MVAIDAAYMVSIFEERIEDIWTATTTPNRTHLEVACRQALNTCFGNSNTILASQALAAAQEDYLAPD
jgi:hypothetical protein